MSQPFLGEIRMFGGSFAPLNWLFCNGQILNISAFNTLYALIGTTYGGDGQQTFALPDLRGRLSVGAGTGSGLTPRTIGEVGGTEGVSLTLQQIPLHGHTPMATNATGNLPAPTNAAVPATPAGTSPSLYSVPGAVTPTPEAFLPNTLAGSGGSIPHTNMMPSLCASFIISTVGNFPSRN